MAGIGAGDSIGELKPVDWLRYLVRSVPVDFIPESAQTSRTEQGKPERNDHKTGKASLWGRLRRPSATVSLGTLLVAGLALGVLVWGGLDTAVEWTNREAICIGCHEMYDNVYVEYQDTIHYNNRTGVRATCADCHVPRAWAIA